MSMISVTGFGCYCTRLPSRVPPLTAQLSALLGKCSAEPSGLRRRGRFYYSSSSELVEETSAGTLSRGRLLERLLERRWLLEQPNAIISKVLLSNSTKTSECQWPELLGQLQFSLQKMTSESVTASDGPMFYVIRDDLLHPLLGGNKLRKLDALLPLLEDCAATDVVAMMGSLCPAFNHSSICLPASISNLNADVESRFLTRRYHVGLTAPRFVACACAERGITAHLLLRGEKPSISTGYNLLSSMYGHSIYVPRSEYADRPAMFRKYAALVAGYSGSISWLNELGDGLTMGPKVEKKVVVVKEGAGDAVALLGLIRLVHYLSLTTVFGNDHQLHIVVDTGTGTTAIGLALGILLLRLTTDGASAELLRGLIWLGHDSLDGLASNLSRLPWKVTGVILADTVTGYEAHKLKLISSFCEQYPLPLAEALQLPLSWKERWKPRKFGNIFPGEVRICQSIAQQTGILLDPIYTLAGWEAATRLCFEDDGEGPGRRTVVMLHTGGTLGLFGLAQRYPKEFN